MSLKRKILLAAVSAVLSCSAIAAGFGKVNVYGGEFTDVFEHKPYRNE